MTLTHAQIDLLKRLAARSNGALGLGPPHHEEWEALERSGYVTIDPATRGDLSVRLYTITDAGRGALAEAGHVT